MQTKVYEYGAERIVHVDKVDRTGNRINFVIAVDSANEGYVMAFMTHDIEPVEGRSVVIRFEKGGPTGGYWKIVRAAKAGEVVVVLDQTRGESTK